MLRVAILATLAFVPSPAAADVPLGPPYFGPNACDEFPDCAHRIVSHLHYHFVSAIRVARACEEEFPNYLARVEPLHQELLNYVNSTFGEEGLSVLIAHYGERMDRPISAECPSHNNLEISVNYAIGTTRHFFNSAPEVWPIERHQISDPELLTSFCLSSYCIESRGND